MIRATPFHALPDVIRLDPKIFYDKRGYFFESYSKPAYDEAIGPIDFVQDNSSLSGYGVFRGMHYQLAPGQAKLVRCTRGTVLDFILDIRHGSPTFSQWTSVLLDSVSHLQIFIPVGFAHGFLALSREAVVEYKCSSLYDNQLERSIAWDSPLLGIKDAVAEQLGGRAPLVSPRDKQAESFEAFTERPPAFQYSPPAAR